MTKEVSNGSFFPFDDGGAEKSGDRRLRRRFRSIISKVTIAVGGSILLFIVYRFHTRAKTRDGIIYGIGSSNILKNPILEKKNQLQKKIQKHHNVRREDQDDEERQNPVHSGPKPKYRWANPRVLPTPPHSNITYNDDAQSKSLNVMPDHGRDLDGRRGKKMKRLDEALVWDNDTDEEMWSSGPKVDYTKLKYEYPENILIPPRGGNYPPMESLGELMKRWPQDDIDSPPQPFKEQLQHFDYLDPIQMEAAVKYRDLEFPFKVYNVPEINAATEKWTDEYLSYHFDGDRRKHSEEIFDKGQVPRTHGHCQQSVDSFFAFFNEQRWNKKKLGPPPTMNNDFTYERFAKHARYADAVGLAPNEEHFYFQAGVPREERNGPKKKWGMISRDLPSFSNPDPTFFGFNPAEQNGIQCRLGERVSDFIVYSTCILLLLSF